MSPTEKSFRVVPCVRACVRGVWLASEIGSQKSLPPFSIFHFGGDELSLFPSPHTPNLQSNFSWAYRYMHMCIWHLTVPVQTARSNAQFGAERFRKGFRRKSESAVECKEVCSSSGFEHYVASKRARAVLQAVHRAQCATKNEASAVFSSSVKKSQLEQ